MDNPPVVLTTQLDPAQDYHLSSISAPVFESQHRIAFELVLTGIAAVGVNGRVSGADILRIGQRLREACDRIGAFVGPTAAAA